MRPGQISSTALRLQLNSRHLSLVFHYTEVDLNVHTGKNKAGVLFPSPWEPVSQKTHTENSKEISEDDATPFQPKLPRITHMRKCDVSEMVVVGQITVGELRGVVRCYDVYERIGTRHSMNLFHGFCRLQYVLNNV